VRLADIVVNAHVLTDGGGVERQEVRFPVASPLTSAGHAEPEVRREILLLDAAKAREEALRRRDEGDLGGAAGVLREMSAMLACAPAELRGELSEQAGDLAALADQFATDQVSEADAKYLAQRAYNAHRGKRAYEEKLARGVRRPRQ
jgi:hypothetical protein